MDDIRLIAAALTIAASACREYPLPGRTSDGKSNVDLIFSEYEGFLEKLTEMDRKRREPGMAR